MSPETAGSLAVAAMVAIVVIVHAAAVWGAEHRQEAIRREAERQRYGPHPYRGWSLHRARLHYGLPCADTRCPCHDHRWERSA